MSSEPERPIEKLLQAAAKERSEQAGNDWEMHPATRRLLQAEVSQRFGKKRGSKSQGLGWLLNAAWLRPVGALAVLAVLITVGLMALRAPEEKKKASLLARNEPQQSPTAENSARAITDKLELNRTDSAALLADNKTKETLNRAVPQELAKDSRVALDRLAAGAQPAAAPSNQVRDQELPPATAAPSPASAERGETAFARRYGLKSNLQPAPPSAASAFDQGSAGAEKQASLAAAANTTASTTMVAPAQLSVSSGEPQSIGGAVPLSGTMGGTDTFQYGYFAATQNVLAGTQPGNQILVSFRLEQRGQELRIIDRDGSVYAGPIQATAAGASAPAPQSAAQPLFSGTFRAAKAQAQSAAPMTSQIQQPSGAVSVFQVVGTNRSSNQRVVFSGTLSGDTNLLNAVAAKREESRTAVTALPESSPAPASPAIQNVRLEGKARIGPGQEVEIEAVPAPPPQPSR